jgi:hypothetical protein
MVSKYENVKNARIIQHVNLPLVEASMSTQENIRRIEPEKQQRCRLHRKTPNKKNNKLILGGKGRQTLTGS